MLDERRNRNQCPVASTEAQHRHSPGVSINPALLLTQQELETPTELDRALDFSKRRLSSPKHTRSCPLTPVSVGTVEWQPAEEVGMILLQVSFVGTYINHPFL